MSVVYMGQEKATHKANTVRTGVLVHSGGVAGSRPGYAEMRSDPRGIVYMPMAMMPYESDGLTDFRRTRAPKVNKVISLHMIQERSAFNSSYTTFWMSSDDLP